MELSHKQTEYIKYFVSNGETLEDLKSLINYIIKLQNDTLGTTYKPVSIKQLTFYFANRDKQYFNFEIPKKTGGVRKITAPDLFLKKIQRRINFALDLLFKPKAAAHGFVTGRSIVSNAKVHVGKKYVYNVDLKDFFPTIHFGRIKAVLQLHPFKMKPKFAQLIAHICCFEGILPQGAPTSPIITNIICQQLDKNLVSFAKFYKCYYTRYADDLTFSSDKNSFKEKFYEDLVLHLTNAGFALNEKKTRKQTRTQRQEVTGIIVNEKLNLQRSYIKKIRAMLYNWEKDGLHACQKNFNQYYPLEKGFFKNKSVPPFENVVMGKILFLGMVRGKDDKYFLEFFSKYQNLSK
ncbi:reverse transcriptase domain-containing protein [Rufibacter psychrotolerans]|uniref:reverse transcriptase domain-containing protein n=1 Tax=Rufibacter psychrotolerans TaxID=2812556 RepID=UPI0019677638|nr:reverse transcriptase domain-containing protein [Rufibacter sp. SYSU D00308]